MLKENISFDGTELLFDTRYPVRAIDWVTLDDYFSSLVTKTVWNKFKRWANEKGRYVFLDNLSSNQKDHFLYIRNHHLEHEVFIFDFVASEPYTLDEALQRIILCENDQSNECRDPNVNKEDFYFLKKSNQSEKSLSKSNQRDKSDQIVSKSKSSLKRNTPNASKSSLKSSRKSKSSPKSSHKSKSSPKSSPKSSRKSKSSPKSSRKSKSSPKSSRKSKSSLKQTPELKQQTPELKQQTPELKQSASIPSKSTKKKSKTKTLSMSQQIQHMSINPKTIPILSMAPSPSDSIVPLCEVKCDKPKLTGVVAIDKYNNNGLASRVLFPQDGNVKEHLGNNTFILETKDNTLEHIHFFQPSNEKYRIAFMLEKAYRSSLTTPYLFYSDVSRLGIKHEYTQSVFQWLTQPQSKARIQQVLKLIDKWIVNLQKENMTHSALTFHTLIIVKNKICAIEWGKSKDNRIQNEYISLVKHIQVNERHFAPENRDVVKFWANAKPDTVFPEDVGLEVKYNIESFQDAQDNSIRTFITSVFGSTANDLCKNRYEYVATRCKTIQKPWVFVTSNEVLKLYKVKKRDEINIKNVEYGLLMHQKFIKSESVIGKQMAPKLYDFKRWDFDSDYLCIGSCQERVGLFSEMLETKIKSKQQMVRYFDLIFQYLQDMCRAGLWHYDAHDANWGFVKDHDNKKLRMILFDYEYASDATYVKTKWIPHSKKNCYWTQDLMLLAHGFWESRARMKPQNLIPVVWGLRHLHFLLRKQTKSQDANAVMAPPSTWYNDFEKDMAFYMLPVHQAICTKHRGDDYRSFYIDAFGSPF